MMDSGQEICLKWNSFHSNIVTSFENLWKEEGLVDVTLASDGRCIRAHKVILSACSPFFKEVFQTNPCRHPVIILQDVHYSELESLLVFMYKGVVNIEQENLPALLRAAETLQIRGLSGASEQVKEKIDATFRADPTAAVTPTPGKDEAKMQERSRIPGTTPAAIADPSSSSSPPPAKRKRPTTQRSQSPPPPDTPLALTPTSRPQRACDLSQSSAEPWEQPQQPGDEDDNPPEITQQHLMEPRHPLSSVSPLMPHMFLEELKEESTRAETTDDSLDSAALLQQQHQHQMHQSQHQHQKHTTLATADTGQLKAELPYRQPSKSQGKRTHYDEECRNELASGHTPSDDEYLLPYQKLPYACLLPRAPVLATWAKARTSEQLACDLMKILFSTEERILCNVNGKMGKLQFNICKIQLIREVLLYYSNLPLAEFEEQWKSCVTKMDTANRGLKRNLVRRERKSTINVL